MIQRTRNRFASLSLFLMMSVILIAAPCLAGPMDAALQSWHPAHAPLMTRWAKQVSPSNALREYPRPQMVRNRWQSLNGLWDYAVTDAGVTDAPTAYTGKILVPYPYESALSGVGKPSIPDQRLWYQRTFTVPDGWRSGGQRVLLHFGAVNYDSQVWVNGTELGKHQGGYDAFDFDITDALKPGDNTLIVAAQNPLRSDIADAQVLGKQRLHPDGIFYTASTGIWQSVWLEPVPTAHILGLTLIPDIDHDSLKVTVTTDAGLAQLVTVTALDGKKTVAVVAGTTDTEMALRIPRPHLWSPDDPYLYNLRVSLDSKNSDAVNSYFAMRKVSLGKNTQDRTCILLNNKPLLQIGLLDQGYWPDGIYTAPTDEALKYDIQMAKKLGFNLLRKHAKVEPDRWYYWTDRLGMLVWQDMPQCFTGDDGVLSDAAKAQWLTEWKREITTHSNHPSIIVWTTFNEGWGQHDTEQIIALTKELDPSRLVNNASGWNDMHVGDIQDTHDYPGPGSGTPEPTRAAVNGEFGGITMRVPGHMWTTDVVGYGRTLSQGWQVTQKYQDLLKNAYGLSKDRGTCAFVYTQITDVEQESNGIMTYDRAVVKPLADIITAANKGQFLPLPPQPPLPVNHDLVPTSQDTSQTWSYTTSKPADDWMVPAFDASSWKMGPAPFGQDVDNIGTPWTDTPGDIWLRRTVTLPEKIAAKLNVLTKHDEDVEVYVNGVLAASAAGYTSDYIALPMADAARAALKPGPNVIAVHCHQTVGGQFIDVGISEAK